MLLRIASLLCFMLAVLELIFAGGNGSLLLLALGIALYNRSELLEIRYSDTMNEMIADWKSKERV